ncbi:MAG: outer membrane protein transport protein [Desulfuromonadales bacterium]
MKKINLQGALVCALILLATISGADEFHYNNILIGDRASGMGGAYIAVSDDPGGMYFNPAGIAYSTGKNLSASVNAYSVSNRTYKGVVGGQDWTRTSATLLPNFFGIIQPIGKFKVGFSYAVPDSNQEDQDQKFLRSDVAATHIINFNNKNDTNLFGPSVAVQLNNSLSVGTTLYVHKRSTEAILNNSIVSDSGTGYVWKGQYTESDEWGVKPIVGIMWAPMDKLSVGMTFSKTVILSSKILTQSTISSDTATLPVRTFDTYTNKRKYPYQVSTGVAFFPNSSLLLSGDINYYSAFDYTLVNTVNNREAVINGAIGAEYYFNKNWAIRSGLFTDFSNTPKIINDTTDQYEHIDMFGGSLTASYFTKNTSISCGGSYKYGSGKAKVIGGASGIQDVTADNWTMFISSSYTY